MLLKKGIIFFLAFVVAVCSRAQSRTWTLTECITHAMEHNVGLKNMETRVYDENISLSEAKWSFAPSVSLGGSCNFSPGNALDGNAYLSAEMGVFNGFRRLRELQRAKLNTKSVMLGLEGAKNEMQADVVAAYLDVLCAREKVADMEQIQSMLEIQTEKIRKSLEAGKVTESDFLQMKTRLYDAKYDVASAANEYSVARLGICRLLEIGNHDSFEAAPLDSLSSSFPWAVYRFSEEEVYGIVSGRPEVRAAELNVDVAKKELEIARSSCLPSVSLSTGCNSGLYSTGGMFGQNSFKPFRPYVSVNLNVPVFSRMSLKSNVARKRNAIRTAEYELYQTKKGLVEEVLHAKLDVMTAKEQYMVARGQFLCADEAARQIAVKYEKGGVNVLDYNIAVSELASARHMLRSAKYQYIFRKLILEMLVSYKDEPLFIR